MAMALFWLVPMTFQLLTVPHCWPAKYSVSLRGRSPPGVVGSEGADGGSAGASGVAGVSVLAGGVSGVLGVLLLFPPQPASRLRAITSASNRAMVFFFM